MSDDETELLRRKLAREQRARKEAESLLEAKSRELYARNQALQQEIAHREQIEKTLAAQAEDLERSNEELQQFAYVASHDLQAPLRNILGFSRLLSNQCAEELGENGQEFLGFIREGAQSMHSLINDLLDLSRLETRGGKMEDISSQSLIESVVRELVPEISACDAQVLFDGLPNVYADEVQLRQLFTNLISNGLKFQSADARPEVRISAEQVEGGWQFCVADNGIGIAPEHQDRIFVIFRRLHTVDEYPGTGIGLAICKKIVDRHGGRIWLESAVGQGARFYFTLLAEGGSTATA